MSEDFNRVYTIGSIILQVNQIRQNKGIVIDLLPQIVIAIANTRLWFGIGFEWVTGKVNIGIMRGSFKKAEEDRLKLIQKKAIEARLTITQYQYRWVP